MQNTIRIILILLFATDDLIAITYILIFISRSGLKGSDM